eukprot:13594279-Heterocapsa_arctica.AAC.1
MGPGGVTSPTGLLALVGCSDPTDITSCTQPDAPSRYHATLEMWPTALQRALDDITIEQPDLVPSHIGAIGYDGMEFMS